MGRVLYDGITATSVPGDGWGVAGYVNGHWPDFEALKARYPHLAHISITVNAQGTAIVLDVEQGDATPAQAPGWVRRMRAAGIAHPVVYMNMATWQAVKNQFAVQGVAPPLYWVAEYDETPIVPAGAVAKQHTSTAGYDRSVVADYWPGVDPAPLHVASAPSLIEENSVQIEPLTVHPGEYAVIVPPNVTSFAVAADGYGAPGAQLRIVLWHSDVSTVLDTFTIGGAAAHHYIGHELNGASALTVRRLDAQPYPVALGFRA